MLTAFMDQYRRVLERGLTSSQKNLVRECF
jgi:hypothetical protein